MQLQRALVIAASIVFLPFGLASDVEGRPESDPAADDPSRWRNLALDRALETAAAVADPYRRAEALAGIARTQASVDGANAANRTISQALAAAKEIGETAFRGWVLHEIVQAQIAAEDLYGARETANLIEADRPHGAALATLAGFQLRAGDLASAETTARKIRDAGAKGDVLRQIVSIRAARGEIDAARGLLRQIKDDFHQALARGDVAVAEIRAGDIEAAHALAARARRTSRAEIYGRIALARVSAGDRRGAADTLQKIEDVLYRAVMQGRIAASRAEAGEQDGVRQSFASAIASVEGATNKRRKALTLAQLARLQTAAGDRTAARVTLRRARAEADRLPPGEERDDAVDYIARSQARAGDAAGALDAALQLNDRVARALLVRDVVTLQRDATGASASARAERFDDPLIEAAAQFGALGVQLLQTGQPISADTINAALAAVRRIDDAQLKPAAFAALSAANIRTGDVVGSSAIFREALSATESLERADQRAAAYVRIANALDERPMFLERPATSD